MFFSPLGHSCVQLTLCVCVCVLDFLIKIQFIAASGHCSANQLPILLSLSICPVDFIHKIVANFAVGHGILCLQQIHYAFVRGVLVFRTNLLQVFRSVGKGKGKIKEKLFLEF